jgi:mono/diheme cytochrome c family protein
MHRVWIMRLLTLASLVLPVVACHREPIMPTMGATPVVEQPAPSNETHELELARGRYVAAIAGCTTCHGADLSGGKAPNITVDPQTGIGKWTDAQIARAIRRGLAPDGHKLAPMMPYPYFNRMTDADVGAVVAFVKSQPAVSKRVARERTAMQAIDMPAPVGNVDRTEDSHAHGEYLATLMHCGACHTPQQGPYANQAFAGTGKMPNITSDRDTGIGSWSEQDIIHAVRDLKDPTGHDLDAPMAFYKDAWATLSDADAHALAVFVMSIPPVHHDVSTDAPPAVSSKP